MKKQPAKQAQQIKLVENEKDIKQEKINRCQEMAKMIQSKIQQQIKSGDIKLRSYPMHINLQHPKKNDQENPQKDIREKIGSLNMDLQLLHKHIAEQKEQQKLKQQKKRRQAAILIQRLKRQKQQHQNKLKLNQMSQRLKFSAFSDDIMKIMRERRQTLIQQKKRDMQLRIYKNLNRKVQREEGRAQKQISYWQKVKQFQENKRHHSTKVLPSIHKVQFSQKEAQQQFGVNMNRYDRKNSVANPIFKHQKSISKQDLTSNYQQIVNKFLEKAKAKKKQSQSQKSPSSHQLSLIVVNQPISQRYGIHYNNQKKTIEDGSPKVQEIAHYYNPNRRKILGNQYLKESLVKVKQDKLNNSRKKALQDSETQQHLEMKGCQANIQKNDKLSILESRREKILQNLSINKISKSLAIQMLGPVQNKLDRIDPNGIQQRLKNKIKIFQQVFKKQPVVQNQNKWVNHQLTNQFDQSVGQQII